MDMATIILSIVFVLLLRAGWLAGAAAYTASGRSTGFVWKLLERTRLSAVFFFFLNFKKKSVNILHNFHHFREEENCVKSTRHAADMFLLLRRHLVVAYFHDKSWQIASSLRGFKVGGFYFFSHLTSAIVPDMIAFNCLSVCPILGWSCCSNLVMTLLHCC
jgi:hypothetical protein